MKVSVQYSTIIYYPRISLRRNCRQTEKNAIIANNKIYNKEKSK